MGWLNEKLKTYRKVTAEAESKRQEELVFRMRMDKHCKKRAAAEAYRFFHDLDGKTAWCRTKADTRGIHNQRFHDKLDENKVQLFAGHVLLLSILYHWALNEGDDNKEWRPNCPHHYTRHTVFYMPYTTPDGKYHQCDIAGASYEGELIEDMLIAYLDNFVPPLA